MVEDITLAEECLVFCNYLIGMRPNEYIVSKYQDAHTDGALGRNRESDYFDRVLVSLAKASLPAMKLADAYSRVFRKNSLLRKKLILLLAILECCAASYARLDSPAECGKIRLHGEIGMRCAAFVLTLFVSAIVLMPLQLACAFRLKLSRL